MGSTSGPPVKDVEPKAVEARGMVPMTGKRQKTSLGTLAPIDKKPREAVTRSYASALRGQLVAVVPTNYPLAMLDHEQVEALKELIADKVDELDEHGEYHPLFDGVSYKVGGEIVAYMNNETCTWLAKIIPSINLVEEITLHTGDLKSFFCTVTPKNDDPALDPSHLLAQGNQPHQFKICLDMIRVVTCHILIQNEDVGTAR
ncbi:unnamed protein product [Nezara viridula]|uniref:DUF4780 domain-containing protein n=1 Tax=Nezara viridula TaxID=85310 RepID=A0A9P0EBV6_NEZVI|nr:unnamed protein product [Nezara viridula]